MRWGWGRPGDVHTDDARVVEIPAPVHVPRPDPQDERRYLEQWAEQLDRDLAEVKERLNRLAETNKE